MTPDLEYFRLLGDVINGEKRDDRTGVGTRGVFGARMHFKLDTHFPLLTTKKIHWKSVVHELLWMIQGGTNVKYLNDHGVTIWDEWANEYGDLGPIYGKQWRDWDGYDQLADLVYNLKREPNSRRHVVSAWNVGELDQMKLPPCHALFQFWISSHDKSLHCQLYQRSADVFLGVPFNVASYSLLTCILADKLGFKRGSLTWVGGDTHIYENHLAQAVQQLARNPRAPPTLAKMERGNPLSVTFDEIKLEGYDPLPAIPAPVAV